MSATKFIIAIRKCYLIPVRIYQICISPLLPACCRYFPTCSEYTIQAVQVHGIIRGTFLATKRILSCHPYSCGGYDPVPSARNKSKI